MMFLLCANLLVYYSNRHIELFTYLGYVYCESMATREVDQLGKMVRSIETCGMLLANIHKPIALIGDELIKMDSSST